jgi:CO/xanthine dehydrogenase FAD-binding subunit
MCDILGPAGTRELPFSEFLVGYRKTALLPDEILLRIRVPVPGSNARQAFYKIGARRAVACSKVSLAASCRLDGKGRFTEVSLAAGSVAPTTVFLPRTISLLTGKSPDLSLSEQAAISARNEVTPIDDVRSTADYRSYILGRLVARWVVKVAFP